MKAKLMCSICKEEHGADSKHFPAAIHSKKDQSILGYICKKCVKKQIKRERKENVK